MKKAESNRGSVTVIHSGFGAGKPVAPALGRQQNVVTRSADPSSCLRADRYPIPSFYEYRANPRG